MYVEFPAYSPLSSTARNLRYLRCFRYLIYLWCIRFLGCQQYIGSTHPPDSPARRSPVVYIVWERRIVPRCFRLKYGSPFWFSNTNPSFPNSRSTIYSQQPAINNQQYPSPFPSSLFLPVTLLPFNLIAYALIRFFFDTRNEYPPESPILCSLISTLFP